MSRGIKPTAEHGQPPSSHEAEPLLRPEAVADLLACSPKTVYEWAARGLLPSIRLGRMVRFRAQDIRRFIEVHAQPRDDAVHGSGLS